MKKGFTLVEVLVVIAVLSIVGGLVVTIFTRSLRGSNKSQIISQIKQNGQSVLETMDKTIRNSDNVVCLSNDIPPKSIVIVKNGVHTRFRFILGSKSNNNGAIKQDNPTPSSQETTPQPFIQRVCQWNDPLISANILTDMNSQTGVSLISGSFARNKLPGFRDIITIQFVLGPGVGAPAAIAGQIDPVTFQTTVELR